MIAFVGALMISLPDVLPLFRAAGDAASAPVMGYLLALFSVVGWGASTVFGKQLSLKEFTESEIMAGRFIFGFIFLAFYATTTQACRRRT